MQETQVWSLGPEDPLEEGMATHSTILAWRIPWTEEPGGLQSIRSQRVGHDWRDRTRTHLRKTLMKPCGVKTKIQCVSQGFLWSLRKKEASLISIGARSLCDHWPGVSFLSNLQINQNATCHKSCEILSLPWKYDSWCMSKEIGQIQQNFQGKLCIFQPIVFTSVSTALNISLWVKDYP